MEDPILAYPDFTKEFYLIADASGTGIGYVLCQLHDGHERVVMYGGRSLSDTEQKGSATEREALAIVSAIKKCHPYLHGKKFTAVCDHKPLKWLLDTKEPTGKLARWAMILQSYDFEIQYRPGRANSAADGLSRIPYDDESTISQEHIHAVVRAPQPEPPLDPLIPRKN